MALTSEEFKEKIEEIRSNLNDVSLATMLLTELHENYVETESNILSLNEQMENIKTDNDKLRACNMELFLKVGTTKKNKSYEDEEIKNKENELHYENLFNDKGELL